MSGIAAFRPYLCDITSFNRSQLAVPAGLRKGVGVAVPLLAALATHHALQAVMLAIGAFSLGFIDQGGPYPARARALLVGCVCVGVSALVGSTLASIGWLVVLLLGLVGFAAGMLVAVGQTAQIMGFQLVVVLAVTSNFPFPPIPALAFAGWAVAGGLFQTVLALAPWPLRRYAPERQALAAAYRELAASAEHLPNDGHAGQREDALARAGTTLTAGAAHMGADPTEETFQALLDSGWGLHLELTALAQARARLAAEEQAQAALHSLDELLRAMAAIIAWPAWEGAQVPRRLAELLEAERRYAAAVLAAYTGPAPDPAERRKRMLQARLTRTNAEASVHRALSEPLRSPLNARTALGLLESAHRFEQSVLALEALCKDAPPRYRQAELRAFAEDVEQALRLLAEVVEQRAPAAPLPPLREDYRALAALLEAPDQSAAERAQGAFLVAQVDRMVDSLTTMCDLLAGEQE